MIFARTSFGATTSAFICRAFFYASCLNNYYNSKGRNNNQVPGSIFENIYPQKYALSDANIYGGVPK